MKWAPVSGVLQHTVLPWASHFSLCDLGFSLEGRMAGWNEGREGEGDGGSKEGGNTED